MSRFTRQESPPQFEDHRKYREFLRRDFQRRCAYCERTEPGLGGEESFEIDHFRPVAKFPDLTTHYPNLYYSCGMCNRHKGKTWPSEGLFSKGFHFADPCEEDMYVVHLEEMQDGRLDTLTRCGEYTLDHIRLNRADLVLWRQTKNKIAAELREFERLTEYLEATLAVTPERALQDEIRAISICSPQPRLAVARYSRCNETSSQFITLDFSHESVAGSRWPVAETEQGSRWEQPADCAWHREAAKQRIKRVRLTTSGIDSPAS